MERALRTILKTSYILIALLLLYGLSFYMVLAVQLPAEQSVLSYIADQYLAPDPEPIHTIQPIAQPAAETTSDEPTVTEDNTPEPIPAIPPVNYHHVDNGNDDDEDDEDNDTSDTTDDSADTSGGTDDDTGTDDAGGDTQDDTADNPSDDNQDDATDDDTTDDDTTVQPPTAFPTFPKLVVTPNPSDASASITATVDSTPADKIDFDDDNIVITLPTGTTGTLIITIDNTQYTVELTSDDVQIETELN
jgi:hypothetical protein